MRQRSFHNTIVKALLTAGCILISSQAFAVNLINNFSFEDPVTTSNGGMWQVYSSITGWQTPLNYIEIQRNGLYGAGANNQAFDGSQWVEIDAPGKGDALRQTVTTDHNSTYSLSFAYSERPGYGVQQMGVYWNNSLVAVVGNDLQVSLAGLNWREYTFNLVSTGTQGILTFASLSNYSNAVTNDAGGNLLDKVILTKTGSSTVPEPATVLLLSSGLLAGIRARKLKTN